MDDRDKGGLLLIGDSLGLAQPLTAEGILPAVVSGRVCAESILAGRPAEYPGRLSTHPLIDEYRRLARLRQAAAAALRPRSSPASPRTPLGRAELRPRASLSSSSPSPLARLSSRAIATGFAWMFSGGRLPAAGLIDLALAGAERWLGRRASTREGST
jgi:hypothetical protein